MKSTLQHSSQLHQRLLSKSSQTLLMKLGSAFMALIVSVLITRMLGATLYGYYAMAMSALSLAGLVVIAGSERLIEREVAGALRTGARRQYVKSINFAVRWNILGWFLVGALILVCCEIFPISRIRWVYWLLPTLFVFLMLRLQQAELKGRQQIIRSRLADQIIRPSLFACLLLLTFGLPAGEPVAIVDSGFEGRTVTQVLWLASAALFATFVLTFLVRQFLSRAHFHHDPAPPAASKLSSTRPKFVVTVGLLLLANNGISDAVNILLGLLSDTHEVALHTVSRRVSNLMQYGNVSAGLVLAPVAATLHAVNDMAALQRALTQAARFAWLIAGPLFLLFLFWPALPLSLFDTSLMEAAPVLQIMAFGQAMNLALGSATLVLTMCGHERTALRGQLFNVAISLIGTVLLADSMGAMGAAIATSIGVVIAKAYICWHVWKLFRLKSWLH